MDKKRKFFYAFIIGSFVFSVIGVLSDTKNLVLKKQSVHSSAHPVEILPPCYLKEKGDANCDNLVNQEDLTIYNQELVILKKGNNGSYEIKCDFNQDGKVDQQDLAILKDNIL